MSGVTNINRLGCDPYSVLIAQRVASQDIEKLSAAAQAAARMFLADTLAVGVAGRCNPAAAGIYRAMHDAGGNGSVSCFGGNDRPLAPHQAAVVNGFLCHCLEWDGLHEPSVVIALCAAVGALSCDVQQSRVSYGNLLLALVLGVETAVFFGSAAATAPKFFRPSAAGVMGAAMAVGKVRGFDERQLLDLLGLAYSQAGGTMQAHWEGSEALALQVGFAARSAITAADLVAAGATGPHDVVVGKFGYFSLFEQPANLDAVLARWGAPWAITEVAHKPFPAGRATQATLTAILNLQQEYGFAAHDVAEVRADVPSLIGLLVGRPYRADMSPSYARLCLQYVVARMLVDGTVDPTRFDQRHFADPEIAAIAARIDCFLDDNPDPNALGPQKVCIRLNDGTVLRQYVDAPLGAPGNPLNRNQRIDKIARCFRSADWPGDPAEFLALCETYPLDAPAAAVVAAVTGGRDGT